MQWGFLGFFMALISVFFGVLLHILPHILLQVFRSFNIELISSNYLHCYKNYSPLQLVGTKHHGFQTLVGPKSKHFGFQYKLMGEASNSLILPLKKTTFRLTCLYLRPKNQYKPVQRVWTYYLLVGTAPKNWR